ncbi:chromate efflux transporter [Nitratireductor basaltis]|nr:chromate efflux transporter [Nitratireductor basaltis]
MADAGEVRRKGWVSEVFAAFLKLGLTSFGGPIAHLGYFRDELVKRRGWLSDDAYAELVALCQFLPGPASSQVGFALGLQRAGALGGLAAWTAFTLPSAFLLVLFAYLADSLQGEVGQGLVHGLKLVAVVIVAQALLGMAHALCPDRKRAAIALAALALVTLLTSAFGQVLAILAGAAAGMTLMARTDDTTAPALAFPVSRRVGFAALVLFALLLFGLPLLNGIAGTGAMEHADIFYRAGALVFGGGHVVLPLLQAGTVEQGLVSSDVFLAGYGAAQAVPGPLFTFAAYLGAVMQGAPSGVAGAALALVFIFLPGILLLVGVLPFWAAIRKFPLAASAIKGANAAVVGILAAALYHPVFTTGVLSPLDFAVAATAFMLLVLWKLPPWMVVVFCALSGVLMAAV